ncbi:MAG: molecular chaperone TorD family protein [Desulfurococcales archaeon]|nr:molecular chaperone TorD family protein [Desulfurococcales archaeon]
MGETTKAQLAYQRASSYILLSQFYLRSPRVDFLKQLIRSLSKVKSLPEELAKIKGILSNPDLEGLSLELRKDYTRLFLGVKPGYSPPPPYESVYRGENRLMGTYTLKVAEWYNKWNFDPAGVLGYKGPPDYLGVELAFMSHLCMLESRAWERRGGYSVKSILEAEGGFLKEHILVWAEQFFNIMDREARTSFYKLIARLSRKFLKLDMEYIEELLREL